MEKVMEFKELKRIQTLNNWRCCVRFGSGVKTDWDETTLTNSQQHITGVQTDGTYNPSSSINLRLSLILKLL